MTGTSLITVNEDLNQCPLTNGRVSMILKVVEGKLINLYTGAAVPDRADFAVPFLREYLRFTEPWG